MKKSRHGDTAYHVAFIALVAAALLLWIWEFMQRPPGPSRIEWPTPSSLSHP
jgi:hypothetical protein